MSHEASNCSEARVVLSPAQRVEGPSYHAYETIHEDVVCVEPTPARRVEGPTMGSATLTRRGDARADSVRVLRSKTSVPRTTEPPQQSEVGAVTRNPTEPEQSTRRWPHPTQHIRCTVWCYRQLLTRSSVCGGHLSVYWPYTGTSVGYEWKLDCKPVATTGRRALMGRLHRHVIGLTKASCDR